VPTPRKHLDVLTTRAGLGEGRATGRPGPSGPCCPSGPTPYVIDELIDWTAAPRRSRLPPRVPAGRHACPGRGPSPGSPGCWPAGAPRPGRLWRAAHDVRMRLNPHPAGQLALNIPDLDDEPLPGSAAQIPGNGPGLPPSRARPANAYCTYCFRWAQFVDEARSQDGYRRIWAGVIDYLRQHCEVDERADHREATR